MSQMETSTKLQAQISELSCFVFFFNLPARLILKRYSFSARADLNILIYICSLPEYFFIYVGN